MEVVITPDLFPMTNKTQERLEILSVLEQLKDEKNSSHKHEYRRIHNRMPLQRFKRIQKRHCCL